MSDIANPRQIRLERRSPSYWRVTFELRQPDKDKALMERGFHKVGDVENRLGYYIGQPGS